MAHMKIIDIDGIATPFNVAATFEDFPTLLDPYLLSQSGRDLLVFGWGYIRSKCSAVDRHSFLYIQ